MGKVRDNCLFVHFITLFGDYHTLLKMINRTLLYCLKLSVFNLNYLQKHALVINNVNKNNIHNVMKIIAKYKAIYKAIILLKKLYKNSDMFLIFV